MKKYLFRFIIIGIILQGLALSGCSQHSAENENQIKTNLSEIIQAVSIKFGETHPENILIKQNVEESSKKPMFFVSFDGNFVHPWESGLEKANKLSFSFSVENKLWAITGLKNNHMLWFIKLPSLKWQEVVNLSKDDYWKKVIVENKYINPKEIAWIRIEGGVPNPLEHKVLFSETDLDKIQKIANIINSGTNKRNSSHDELNSLSSSMFCPPTLVIKMKYGKKISFWRPYKIIETKLKSGVKVEGRAFNDRRFVMSIENLPNNDFFTIYSKDVVNYINSDSQKDMPRTIVPFSAEPKDKPLKVGDKIVLSGNDCTEKEVNIYLQSNSKEKYLISKVYPKLGKWKWEWIVQRNFKTLDGKEVTLKKVRYSLMAEGEVLLLGAVDVNLRR